MPTGSLGGGADVADQSKIGKDWSDEEDEELDQIVLDHFTMLQHHLAGRPYVKAHHAARLMDQIGRTHRSVEFKHMNISAVLRELAMPTIPGYKAKDNYQGSIFTAIERYLDANPSIIGIVSAQPEGFAGPASVFEEPAPIPIEQEFRPASLERLVRKFDPVERDAKNKALGTAGEALIIDLEQRRLRDLDRPDLARKVRWVAEEEGDGAGFDVLSFDPGGREKLIEVKTTCGPQRTPFFLSRNEAGLAQERADESRIYRLYEFRKSPKLFQLRPPLEKSLFLTPESYRASFGQKSWVPAFAGMSGRGGCASRFYRHSGGK